MKIGILYAAVLTLREPGKDESELKGCKVRFVVPATFVGPNKDQESAVARPDDVTTVLKQTITELEKEKDYPAGAIAEIREIEGVGIVFVPELEG